MLVLGLFSSILAQPQRDWPPQTRVAGFLFHDGLPGRRTMSGSLERFLASGPPPVVFTLGSAATFIPGDFWEESVAALRQLHVRAVLVTGKEPQRVPRDLPDHILAVDYAPYSLLFRRSEIVVHHGGIGSAAHGLLAGRPMLVTPFCHDQPDNAARLQRLGVARMIPRSSYRARRIAREIDTLRSDPGYRSRAAEAAEYVRREDGLRNACDAIEELLANGNLGGRSSCL
jgi:UDP:flavonoid glycosyltransferase YjiC (YdhE family)